MSYIVPRVLIRQEFSQVPVFGDQPLSALIIGPQFDLYRYANSNEKVKTKAVHPSNSLLGNAYQYGSSLTYNFPTQAAGTFVDKDYVKVFFEKAQLEYFPNDLATISPVVTRRETVAGSGKYFSNQLLASALVFKTANGVSRSAKFSNRDVAPGDIVSISDGTTTATSKIKSLKYSSTSAILNAATPDGSNQADVAAVLNNAVVPGTSNTGNATVTVANQTSNPGGTAPSGGFKGGFLANGTYINTETFKATVTAPGNLSAVRFAISSTNGLVGSEQLTAIQLGSQTGFTVNDADELSLYSYGGKDVILDFTGSTNFVVGDTWSVTVTAQITKATVPTATGTFTGPSDTNYKLTVVRGGPFYDASANGGLGNGSVCARVSVTSNNTDSSATASPVAATAFTVGNYGVTATFALQSAIYGGLITGNVYYIPATAAAPAATNVIEVYDNLPAGFLAGTGTWNVTSMRLFKDYQVNALIPDSAGLNWQVTDQTITINSGITSADPNVLNLLGVPRAMNVLAANIFIEHRDLNITNALSIGSLTDPGLVDDILGTIDPDNPLAQGVYDALLNSAGVVVYFAGVQTNDLAGYQNVLSLAEKAETYYGVTPLTFDTAIKDAVVGHVNAMSTPENAKWRVAWLSAQLTPTALIYDKKADGTDWTGTLLDDPLTADLATPIYTLLTVPGATFVTDGVRTTDKVLINFYVNAFGTLVSSEYTVSEVRTETTLVIATGPTLAVNVAAKIQIKRVYTKDEQINTLALVGSAYNNRRVRAVFPETTKLGSVVKPGYFLAAALAGLRSGVVPHQGLTNAEILGFSDLTQSFSTFTETQLNRLAQEGYWIATQAAVGATPYVRHQLTTDSVSLNASEDSVTTNVDSISYGLRRVLAPYIGQYNVNKNTLLLVEATIYNELRYRQLNTFTARAGNQLNGFEIISLAANLTFKDRIDATIQLDVPYPLNAITVTLLV